MSGNFFPKVTPCCDNGGAGEYIAFIGDSTTARGWIPRFTDGTTGRNGTENFLTGIGTLTIYDDETLRWTAFGDTEGERTSCIEGQMTLLQSGTAGNESGFYLIPGTFAFGTPEGTGVPVDVFANPYGIGNVFETPAVMGQVLSGQRFPMHPSLGVSGATTLEVLNRIHQVYEMDSYCLPSMIFPKIVVVLVGINDLGSDIPTITGYMRQIKDYVVSRGSIVVFGTLADEVPDAWIAEVNDFIRGMAQTNSVYVADYGLACNGIAGTMDGAHYNPLGARLAGQALADVLVEIGGMGVSKFKLGSTGNLVVNGAMAGTAGVLTGMTGVAAVDSTYTGAGTCVASKQAVTGQNDKQVYTVTGAANGDTIAVVFDQTWTVGQNIFGGLDVEITGDGAQSADCIVQFDGGGRVEQFHGLRVSINSPGLSAGAFLGRLQTFNVPVPTYDVDGKFIALITLSAGDMVIKLQNAGVRVV